MGFLTQDLSKDGFLGGKLTIHQPKQGYRAATDPVFLAASVNAKHGQSVLELGCGAGVASLCLATRVPGLDLTGVELQPDYADLAMRNARDNGLDFSVTCADLADLPPELTARGFDHVLANPPFFEPGAGTPATDVGKETALREDTPLTVWFDTAIRRLNPRGNLWIIHLASRLPQVLACLDARVGSVTVKPLAPRIGKPAGRVIVRAQKGAKGGFSLCAPLIVHQGAQHEKDGESYTGDVAVILRKGAALNF